MDMVSDLSKGFRAKLGNFWSLCNYIETSKQLYIIAFTNPAQLSEEVPSLPCEIASSLESQFTFSLHEHREMYGNLAM